jgi:hypothetical protein
VPDVQKAVGLRREAGLDVVEATAGQVLLDELLDKVCGLSHFIFHGGSSPIAAKMAAHCHLMELL